MQKDTFVQLGNIVERIVENVRRQMRSNLERRYQVPATEHTKRATKRMVGERDEE